MKSKIAASVALMGLLLCVANSSALSHSRATDTEVQPDIHGMHFENVVAHVDGMLQYIYENVGTNQTQKAQLTAISDAAAKDLTPLHEQLARTHAQVFGMLTQATIDRTALEAVRAEQMRIVDAVSKRAMQFVADIAEALTPPQRKALADHFGHSAN